MPEIHVRARPEADLSDRAIELQLAGAVYAAGLGGIDCLRFESQQYVFPDLDSNQANVLYKYLEKLSAFDSKKK
jgi:hypothetical protein